MEAYAQLHGQSVAEALDHLLAAQLEWEQEDCEDAIKAVRQGYEDVKAGHTRPAEEFLEDLRVKYGFPR